MTIARQRVPRAPGLAIDATKELVRLVVHTAATATGRPAALTGWAAFQQKWLAATRFGGCAVCSRSA